MIPPYSEGRPLEAGLQEQTRGLAPLVWGVLQKAIDHLVIAVVYRDIDDNGHGLCQSIPEHVFKFI